MSFWQTTSGTNSPLSLAVNATQGMFLKTIIWSYAPGSASGTASGTCTVADGSTTIINFDITNSGPGMMFFPSTTTFNHATGTVNLSAGGVGTTGKLSIQTQTTA